MVGGLPTLVRIDARRPATWLVAAAAALVAGLLPAELPDAALPPSVVAAVGGALLAVAAVGAPPRTGARTLDAVWIAARATWPLVAWSVVAWSRGAWLVASWGAGGIAAAAALFMLLGNLDLAAADAASVVLAAAGLAGAAGWWAARQVPEATWAPAAAVAVMAAIMPVVAVCGAGLRCGRMPPLRHAVRRGLTAAAMISALLGMAGWLFLAPEFAALDLAASLAWFSALAGPATTLGDGSSHRREWRRVERSVPRAGGAGRRLVPGRRRDSILAALVNAAILGWPPLVAAAVSGFGGQRSVPAALIAAAVTAAACLLLALTEAGDALGASPELEQAVALGGIVVLAALVVGGSPGFPIFPPGRT